MLAFLAEVSRLSFKTSNMCIRQTSWRSLEGMSPSPQYCQSGSELLLRSFTERMLNMHPKAILLDRCDLPSKDVMQSSQQHLQIFSVAPLPDRAFPIFTNPDVPPGKSSQTTPLRKFAHWDLQAVRAYYEMNGTNRFSYTKPFQKTEPTARIYDAIFPSEFQSTWTEKVTLTCADAFPAVLKRTEVVERDSEEYSPLEISLEHVERRSIELNAILRRYTAIKDARPTEPVNTQPLAMVLNDAVDTGDAGIPLFRNSKNEVKRFRR